MYFLSWLCSIFCLASFVSFGLSELSEICWWYDYIKTRSPLFHLLHGKVHADFNVSCFAALFRARTSEFQCPLCSGLAWEPLVVMCCQKVRLRSSRSEFRGTQEAAGIEGRSGRERQCFEFDLRGVGSAVSKLKSSCFAVLIKWH